jgi:hypothetical protein
MKKNWLSLLGLSLLVLLLNPWSQDHASPRFDPGPVPVGAVLPFYGNNNQLPAGYLFCNGDPVLRSQYTALYDHLVTANPTLRIDETRVRLPNLQGEFIRGWDNGRGVDPGRALGSPQEDMVKSHDHYIPGEVQFFVHGQGGFRSVEGNADTNRSDPRTNSYGGPETRPRNIAVSFIIKY